MNQFFAQYFFLKNVWVYRTPIPQVSQKYGFEKTAAGAMQFSAELQRYQDDPEIRRAHDNLKRSFMPAALLEQSSTSAPADDAME